MHQRWGNERKPHQEGPRDRKKKSRKFQNSVQAGDKEINQNEPIAATANMVAEEVVLAQYRNMQLDFKEMQSLFGETMGHFGALADEFWDWDEYPHRREWKLLYNDMTEVSDRMQHFGLAFDALRLPVTGDTAQSVSAPKEMDRCPQESSEGRFSDSKKRRLRKQATNRWYRQHGQ